MMIYEVSIRSGWLSQEEFIRYCSSNLVDPIARLILTSDGTVTAYLKALFLTPIDLEVKDQNEAEAGDDLADYLDIDPSEKIMNRTIWLKTKGNRLVYAASKVPIDRIENRIYRELKEKRKPLGMLLGEYNIPAYKDLIEIGEIESRGVASDLKLDPDSLFWARHYRLNMDGGARASITEVFSPLVFDSLKHKLPYKEMHGG